MWEWARGQKLEVLASARVGSCELTCPGLGNINLQQRDQKPQLQSM